MLKFGEVIKEVNKSEEPIKNPQADSWLLILNVIYQRIFMSEIQFVHLYEIEEEKFITLMNHEMVGKLMPLLKNGFSKEDCQNFLQVIGVRW